MLEEFVMIRIGKGDVVDGLDLCGLPQLLYRGNEAFGARVQKVNRVASL
jgi:hypothetical protein